MWDLSQGITLTGKHPSEGMIINFENNFVIITGCCEMLRITALHLKLNLKEQKIKITTYRKIIPPSFGTSANRYVCIHITLCVHLRSFSFLLFHPIHQYIHQSLSTMSPFGKWHHTSTAVCLRSGSFTDKGWIKVISLEFSNSLTIPMVQISAAAHFPTPWFPFM